MIDNIDIDIKLEVVPHAHNSTKNLPETLARIAEAFFPISLARSTLDFEPRPLAVRALRNQNSNSALKGDHARGAVAAEADAEQGGPRDGALQGAEVGGDEAAGNSSLNGVREGEVGVVGCGAQQGSMGEPQHLQKKRRAPDSAFAGARV